MADQLFTVYTAPTFNEAEMIHQALEEAGIRAFIEQTPSPLDGLNSINQGTPVMVNDNDADAARDIVNAFLAEHAADDATADDE
ncbi:DUF2007 domain-containing protein [Planctomycetales bacterium ZRK34]|nr:DUF2007 domain-containing protein [Planctomycetales bacterium ZRK34]